MIWVAMSYGAWRREATMADDKTDGGRGADRSRHQGAGRVDAGFGDEQGTRVGRPDPGQAPAAPSSAAGVPDGEEGSILEGEETRRGVSQKDRGNTGAGSEAAEGIHSTKPRQPEQRSGVEHAHGEPGRGEGAGLSGSEPLRHRETEHKSGYGGEKGEPKTSSDQR
jgi:hypothetical protein